MNWFVTIGGLSYNLIIIAVVYIWILVRKKVAGESGEFMFSGRTMPWFPCACSMALTALGGGHVNGLAFESWNNGVAAVFYVIGSGVSMIILMRFTGIWYRRSGAATINDVIGKMFHPMLVPILGGIGVVYCWAILCVETQAMATIIDGLTGLGNLAGALIGASIGVLYVLLAGMKEIGYVNVFNALLLYAFGVVVLIYLGLTISGTGGWEVMNSKLYEESPQLVHALGDSTILKTYVIGTFVATCFGINMAQPNLQATASVDNVDVLKKACTWAIPMNVFFGAIILSMGLAAKVLPVSGDVPFGSDGVILMVLTYLPDWLKISIIGMFLAAMLSTFAMVALAIATMFNRDILAYFPYFENMPEKKETFFCRLWILISGLTAAVAAVSIRAGVNQTITWLFAWNIPLFFIFIIGLYWKCSRIAGVATLFFCWFLNIVLTFTPLASMIGLEGNIYSIFMASTSFIVGLIITALDKNAKENFRKTYIRQRAAYDAQRLAAQTVQAKGDA